MRLGSTVNRWTPTDISFLSQNFNSQSDEEIARVINRSPEAVQTKRMELKLIKDEAFALERSKKTRFKKGNVPVITPHHLKKKRKDSWTDEEIAYLKANWETMTGQQMADALKRSRDGVCSKACDLGLKKSVEATKAIRRRLIGQIIRKDGWLPDQVAYLKQNWAKFSAAEISAVIGRSASACKTKAREFGLMTDKETLIRLCKIRNAGMYEAKGTVGSITTRTNKKGVKTMWIKTADKTWQQLHRYNWLAAGNEIPFGYAVCFKDGDSTHCDVSNLETLPMGKQCQREASAEKALRESARVEAKMLVAAQRIEKQRLKREKREEQRRIAELTRLFANHKLNLDAEAKNQLRIDQFNERLQLQKLRDEKKREKDLKKDSARQERLATQAARKRINTQRIEQQRQEREAAALRQAQRKIAKPVKEPKPLRVKPEIVKRIKEIAVKTDKPVRAKHKAKLVADPADRIKAREIKALAKAKLKAIRLQKDLKAQKEQEDKRQFQTRQIDYSQLITVRIDHKTIIQVKPGTDIEALKAKYGVKPKDEPVNAFGHVPPDYQF